ncbi:hypothetical protein Hanom_Chr06g00562831 [Helianthus anomalus]
MGQKCMGQNHQQVEHGAEMYGAKPPAGKLPITVLNHHGSGYFCEFKRIGFHLSKIQWLRMIL